MSQMNKSELGILLLMAHPKTLDEDNKLFEAGQFNDQHYPPLGILYLSAALGEVGYESKVIDCWTDYQLREKIEEHLSSYKTNLVGVSFTSFCIRGANNLIKLIKEINPEAKIVLGGPHITHSPKSVKYMKADFGVRGDGEAAIIELADSIVENRKPESAGLFHADHPFVDSVIPASEKELDKFKFPDIQKLPAEDYSFPLYTYKATTMVASRGCPFSCSFCGLTHLGKFNFRSPSNIVDEMELRVAQGFEYIDFKDDIFSLNVKHTRELCEEIIRRGLKIKWGVETRIDCVNENLVRLAREAGCLNMKFGIETGSKRIQKTMGKNLNLPKAVEKIKILRKYNMLTITYILFGFPTETKQDMYDTIDYLVALDPDIFDSNMISPLPGSAVFKAGVKEGKFSDEIWHEVAEGASIPVYIPDGFTTADLEAMRRRAFFKFYLRPHIIFRHIILHSSSLSNLVYCAKSGARMILKNIARAIQHFFTKKTWIDFQ